MLYSALRLFSLLSLVLFAAISRAEVSSEVTSDAGALAMPPLPPPTPSPTTEFFAAAVNGDRAALQKSLDEGISPDAPVPYPTPPDILALFPKGSHGALVLKDPGVTALMLATAAGRVETMELLIAAKANVEVLTHSGLRPLDVAADRKDIAAMQLLLGVQPDSEAKKLTILVDLAGQTATVSRGGETVLTTKISSGKKAKPTPPGTYVVTQKYTDWRSTLYHNASMPFFLRLSCGPVGLHQGVLPGYPASHGCVRMPAAVAKKMYALIPKGTVVEIR